jgi:hypothetical protein
MVPWTPQHDSDRLCFPSSTWMVYRYFADLYSGESVRQRLGPITYAELVELCVGTGKEKGTRINEDLMHRLTNRFISLLASLRRGVNLDDAKERADRGIPTILVYEGSYVLHGLRGPAHAGVYIGQAANGDPILNNPWVSSAFAPNRQRFLDGWELRGRKAVYLDPVQITTLEGL